MWVGEVTCARAPAQIPLAPRPALGGASVAIQGPPFLLCTSWSQWLPTQESLGSASSGCCLLFSKA